MQLTCPRCGFSKQIDQEKFPEAATRANCPRCKNSFSLQQKPPDPTEEKVTTTEQESEQQKLVPLRAQIDALPKAGFWMRLVATIIDVFIVFVLEFLLGSLLAVAGFATASGHEGAFGNIAILIQLFGYALSFAYYIVFTGYCGQTPGKMALRIKVIRCDGANISYGRAAFREIPAKFISGIIFGIGYLMVAFDEQKQGLHDRMADTYVIKL
ncbi:MAG: zinc-ribbon domain-containing protein [Deltaproteobacteria bacterium]|nr:zinc-ribbon domain-containing protein [Deltaproteobacteria bacterium]MCW9049530.1 zinc-ribbon domain-containing protein [Deltaproteobacteria bacterium]